MDWSDFAKRIPTAHFSLPKKKQEERCVNCRFSTLKLEELRAAMPPKQSSAAKAPPKRKGQTPAAPEQDLAAAALCLSVQTVS